MAWTARILGAMVALALVGCGGAVEQPIAAMPASTPAGPANPDAVAPTDGRLGPATTATDDGVVDELSPGGRPDVRSTDEPEDRAGVGAAASCTAPELDPVGGSLPAVLASTLCLLNAERVDRGLARLSENGRLATAARRYAGDLVAGGYFSHTGRDGSDVGTRLRRVGYIPADRAWAVGENLAWGTGPLATPAAIVRAWMNSPGHRANVLDPRYREIGLGVVTGNPAGADGVGATYAAEFGYVAAPADRKLRKRTVRSLRRVARRG
jgi:uncharacterized protein YkwD